MNLFRDYWYINGEVNINKRVFWYQKVKWGEVDRFEHYVLAKGQYCASFYLIWWEVLVSEHDLITIICGNDISTFPYSLHIITFSDSVLFFCFCFCEWKEICAGRVFFCLVIWGESSLFDLVICWLYLKRSSTIPFHNQVPKILQFGNASKEHGCYILNQNFSDPFVALSNDHDWQLCVVTGESSLSLSESFISSSIFIFFLVTMFKYSIPSAFHSRIKVDHGNDWNMTKYNLFFCCYV